MTETPQRMSRRAFALVFGGALVLRWLGVWLLASSELAHVPVGDARGYVEHAARIAGGEWSGSEVFYQAPLYPYVLGALFAVFGEGLLVPRLAQGVLGALACALTASVTTRMAGRRAGMLAGAAAALYAPWIWHDGLLQKTSLALFLTALLVALCERVRRVESPVAALWVGLVLGLLGLTRENALVLLFPCGWLVFRSSGARGLVAAASGLVLVLAPVALRNRALGGAPLPTASNVGVNLYIGNGPEADGFYVPLHSGRGHTDYEADDATRMAERAVGRPLRADEVSGWFAERAFEAIRADPLRAARLAGRKAFLLVNGHEAMDAVSFEAYRSESTLLALLGGVTRFWLLLPLAVLGIALRPRGELSTFLVASAVLLAASILPFFVTGRFRMGLVPLLLPFVGIGLDRWREARPAGVVLAVWALGLGLLPLHPRGDEEATTWANVSSELLRREAYERAEGCAARALEHDPEDAAAHYNRGLAAKALGWLDDAERSFQGSIAGGTAYAADAWAEIGSVRAMKGEVDGAEEALDEALRLTPGHAAASYYRGLLRRADGRPEEAAQAYEAALEADPGFADARHNLAHVRLAQGRSTEAVEALRENVRRAPSFVASMKLLALLLASHPDDSIRDGAGALELAERLVELTDGKDPEARAARAFALAELGRFGEAREELARARELEPSAERWSEAAALFEENRPLRNEAWAAD